MEKREKKFLIAGIIFSVIMIVFSYTAITSKNEEQAEISKGSVQYQETKSQISIGKTINNKLEGSGIQRSKSGNIYSGNFENGKKNGKVSILTKTVLRIKAHLKIVVLKMVNLY